jgi:hypothetical protein
LSKDIGILLKSGKAQRGRYLLKKKLLNLKVSEKENQILLSEKEQAISLMLTYSFTKSTSQ